MFAINNILSRFSHPVVELKIIGKSSSFMFTFCTRLIAFAFVQGYKKTLKSAKIAEFYGLNPVIFYKIALNIDLSKVSILVYLTEFTLETVCSFNPYLTNGFSHHYQLGESTFIFRGVRSDF